jgi:hypothetical protein
MWPPVKAKPGAVKPHLVVKLKVGYTLDRKGKRFVSSEGYRFSPGAALPKGSAVVPMAPALARVPPDKLSQDEANLARYVQIVLPKGQNPAKYVALVRGWQCVEEVSLPPQVSLPKKAASA